MDIILAAAVGAKVGTAVVYVVTSVTLRMRLFPVSAMYKFSVEKEVNIAVRTDD